MLDKTILAVVIGSAIMHNGNYYDVGDEIELTEQEFTDLGLYVQVKEDNVNDDEAFLLAQQAEQEQATLRLQQEQELISLRHLTTQQQQTIDTQAMDYQQLQQRHDEVLAENERLKVELEKLQTAKPSRKKASSDNPAETDTPPSDTNNPTEGE